jgi:hypothetical protein
MTDKELMQALIRKTYYMYLAAHEDETDMDAMLKGYCKEYTSSEEGYEALFQAFLNTPYCRGVENIHNY